MNKNLRNIVLTPKNDKLKLWQEGKKIQATRAATAGNPLTMYNVSTGNVIETKAIDNLVTHGDFGYIGGTEDTYTFDMGIKVAGDVVNCPCKIYSQDVNLASLPNPTTGWTEDTLQADIDKLKTQDGTSLTNSTSVNGVAKAKVLELDLTPLCNQKYSGSNSAMKADLKNTDGIIADAWVLGSGSNASVLTYGVKSKLWNATSAAWETTGSENTSSLIAKITRNVSSSNFITSTNKLYLLIHAIYPSDGTIASSVSLDFAQIKITTNRVADTVTPKQVYLPKYWCMVGSFSPNFDSSNANNKRIFAFYTDTNNRWVLVRGSDGKITFSKIKQGVLVQLLASIQTFSKNQLYRFAVGQSASGMFMVLLKNNGTIEKITNTDVAELKGLFPLHLLNQNNAEHGDMFSDIFGLYDLQALGKPNSFTDAEYEGILRGRVGTKNLVKFDDWYIGSGTGTKLTSSYSMANISHLRIIKNIEVGKTYTVSSNNSNFILRIRDTNNVLLGTQPSGKSYTPMQTPIIFEIFNSTGSTQEYGSLMIEEGTTATTYEPYLENPLAIQQKNLFNIDAVMLHANATRSGGVITLNATDTFQGSTINISVLPNNNYQFEVNTTGRTYYTFYYNNIALSSAQGILIGNRTTSVAIPNNCNKIRLNFDNTATGTFTFSNISLKLKM